MSKRWFVPAVLVAAALSLVVSLGVSSAQPTGGAAAGTLKVGAAQGIPQLNPVIRTFAWEEVLFPLLWDGLTKWTPSGATAPDLATSWTGSKDSKTWTFKLRSGVKYSNGDALTATDVVNTFNYYLDPKTVSQEKNRIDMVKTITAVNPTTVRVQAQDRERPVPDGDHQRQDREDGRSGELQQEPDHDRPVQGRVVRARLDRDARAEPGLLRCQGEADQDRDRQGSRLDRGDRRARCRRPGRPLGPPVVLGQEGGKRARVAPSSSSRLWLPRSPRSGRPTPRARRSTTSRTVRRWPTRSTARRSSSRPIAGLGIVSPTNTLLSVNNPAYGAPAGGKLTNYSYNLAKAKKLFAEGGLKSGSTLTWWSTPALPEFQTQGLILQASLAKIGIKLKIENHEIATWVAKFYPGGKKFPGLIVPNANSGPVEAAYNFNFYLPKRCECNWSPANFNKAYSKALQTARPEEAEPGLAPGSGDREQRRADLGATPGADRLGREEERDGSLGRGWRPAPHRERREQRLTGGRRRPTDAPVRRQARGYQHPLAGSHVRPGVLRAAPLARRPRHHQPRRQPGRQPGDDRPAPPRGRDRPADHHAVSELGVGGAARRPRQVLLQSVSGLGADQEPARGDARARLPRRVPVGPVRRPGCAVGGSAPQGRRRHRLWMRSGR